jgi:hypothetical protein
MANRVLVVNGWSNAGKTSFCNWLEKMHGFVHVNADKNGVDKHGLRAVWDKTGAGDAKEFKAVLEQRSSATVFDWPYPPPGGFPFVEALQREGVPVWWFDAEPDAAWQSFVDRAEGNPDDFKRLAEAIQKHDGEVKAKYGDRLLQTLKRDGSWFCRLPPSEIWKRIRAKEGW